MIITILITVRFDWKSEEKLLNSFPQFTTEISGLQVHFIRAAPKPKKGQVSFPPLSCYGSSKVVLPLLLVHGWPGSVVEFFDIIPLLVEGNAKVLGKVHKKKYSLLVVIYY